MTVVVVLGAICTAAMLGIFALRWPEADRMVRVWDIVKSVIALAVVAFLVHWLQPEGWWLVGTIILYIGFVVASAAIVAPFSWGYTPAPGDPPLRAIDRWVWTKGPLRMRLSCKIRKPRSLHNWLAKGSAEGHHRVVWWRGLLAIVMILSVLIAGIVNYFNGDDNSTSQGGSSTSTTDGPIRSVVSWGQLLALPEEVQHAAHCAGMLDERPEPGDKSGKGNALLSAAATASFPSGASVARTIVGGREDFVQAPNEGNKVVNPDDDPDPTKGEMPVIRADQAWIITPGPDWTCKYELAEPGVYYHLPSYREGSGINLNTGLLLLPDPSLESPWRLFTDRPQGRDPAS